MKRLLSGVVAILTLFAFATSLIAAAQDPVVYQAQKILKGMGYNPGPVDGLWGRKTETAVRKFQQDQGLLVTGKLDQGTRNALGIVERSPTLPIVHIQVKTFVPGNATGNVGRKAEKDFGENFFWVLGGIPHPGQHAAFAYYVIPSRDMAEHVSKAHKLWLAAPGKKGQAHRDSAVRIVRLPSHKAFSGWDISPYRDRWDLIEAKLKA